MLQKPRQYETPTLNLARPPKPHVVTLGEYQYYSDACEAFQSAGEEDAYTLEVVQVQFPGLTQLDACSFAVYGVPTQEWLTMEDDLNRAASDNEQLRIIVESANRQLWEQYEIIMNAIKKIEDSLKAE